MNKNHLLCVQESKEIGRLVADVLEDCEIVSVGNLAAARRLIAEKNFDLFLVDIALSDGDGLELCRFIREQDRNEDVPVLFLSGGRGVTTTEMELAGAQGYVAKNARFVENLETRVAQLLEK